MFTKSLLVLVALLGAQLVAGAWPGGPLKAIYIDVGANPAVIKSIADSGYNLIVLAFFVSGKPLDAAGVWGGISNRSDIVNYLHSKNAKIIVSAGGSTDTPYSSTTGANYGTAVANWAKANDLDGVDFDLENFGAGFTHGSLNTAACIQWVADATNAARKILGASAIITHAPQPPYFGANGGFGNAYPQIYAKANSIDFLLVQYYNNGPATTYEAIFVSANGGAVSEIVKEGVPLNKIVVGKPVASNDGGAGYMTAAQIHDVFATAQKNLNWNTGVMGWQWHDATTNHNWISTIY